MNNINFTGNFIKSVNIQKRVNGKHYEPLPASLVKIDLKNKDDIKALKLATYEWGTDSYMANIYLNELDEFMQELKDKFDVGDCTRRKVSYEYESVRGRAMKYSIWN